MSKAIIADAVREKTNVTQREAADAAQFVLASLTKAISREGEVRIPGFGTFKVAKRKARTGRNPQTGEQIEIPASKTVKFRPSKELRAAL